MTTTASLTSLCASVSAECGSLDVAQVESKDVDRRKNMPVPENREDTVELVVRRVFTEKSRIGCVINMAPLGAEMIWRDCGDGCALLRRRDARGGAGQGRISSMHR